LTVCCWSDTQLYFWRI